MVSEYVGIALARASDIPIEYRKQCERLFENGFRCIELATPNVGAYARSSSVSIVETERGVLWFDGSIYDLRDLEGGHETRFRNENPSQAERLAWAIARDGIEVVMNLNGDFSIAWIDRTQGLIWLARDILGLRPLFFSDLGEGLVWSTSLDALFMVRGGRPAPNLPWLHDCIRSGILAEIGRAHV